jgi:ribosomal-protein-alanine N-acetyltransferase
VRWHIQELKNEHLQQIMQIEKASFPTPWTEGMFLSELSSANSHHFVATKQDRGKAVVLCYIFFWMFMEEVHILNLATHPEFRKLGIASALLLFVFDFAYRKGGIIYLLEVREGNQAAVSLYQKMGFSAWGIRKKYYADTGEDGILMGLIYADRLYISKDDKQSHLP